MVTNAGRWRKAFIWVKYHFPAIRCSGATDKGEVFSMKVCPIKPEGRDIWGMQEGLEPETKKPCRVAFPLLIATAP